MKSDQKRILLGYLLEAILIFGSVYGAFLLEARRSTAFEREQLVGFLEVLVDELKSEELKFHDMYEDIDSAGYFHGDLELYNDIKYDTLAIQLLESNKSYRFDTVFHYYSNSKILNTIDTKYFRSWETEQSTLSQVFNFKHLFLQEETLWFLNAYNDSRELIIQINLENIELNKRLIEEFDTEIVFYGQNITPIQAREFVSSSLFLNTLYRRRHSDFRMYAEAKGLANFSPKLINKLEEEISSQRDKL